MASPYSISVVVPTYRGAKTLPLLVARLERALTGLTGEYEIILVNDGSPDETATVFESLTEKYSNLVCLNLSRNFGQHNALLAGIRAARHEVIVTLDDDLQNPPEEIHKLVSALGDKGEVIYGSPIEKAHEGWRNRGSQITRFALAFVMGDVAARDVSAFRAFFTRLRDGFQDYRGSFICIDALLSWGTTRFHSVSVRHDARHSGVSNYRLGKLIAHALNMVTSYTTLPLRLATILGFLCVFFGVAVLTVVVASYFAYGSVVSGFPFLASTIAIFSGTQLFVLGVMGEYLGRIHFRSMERPSYVVSETIQSTAKPKRRARS